MKEKIKELLMPELYNQEITTPEGLELLLVRKSQLAKYCLAVVGYDDQQEVSSQISEVRRIVRRSMRAMWLLNEVGLFIVFCSGKKPKILDSGDLRVDSTGFHAVILQGVHICGPNNFHLYNHSTWGGKAFGNSGEVSVLIQRIET